MSDGLQTKVESHPQSVAKPWRGPAGLRAFRHRNFLLYWIGQIISFTGSWMQIVAQGWLVLKLTGSALDLGIVTASSTLPVMILGLPAGALADRFDKRRLVIATQSLAMVQALTLAVLTYTGVVQVWHVIVLALLLGTVNAFDTPIRHSMLVELVDDDKNDLLSAASLGSAAFNGARVMGPALAGVLLAAVGMANCFLINAITYVVAVTTLLMMTSSKRPLLISETPMFGQIREGMSYALRTPLLRDLLIMSGISGVFGGQINTVMPLFAETVFHAGPKGLGTLMASTGIGALLGAVLLTGLGHSFRQRTLVLFGGLFAASSLLAFARSYSYSLAIACLISVGFGSMLFMAVSNSILQAASRDSFRGRVISLRVFVILGLAPVGALLMGFLAERFGVRSAVTIGGIVCLASACHFILSSKAIRSFR